MNGNSGRTANIEKAASSAREPTKNESAAVPEADYDVEHTDALILLTSFPCCLQASTHPAGSGQGQPGRRSRRGQVGTC